MKGNFIYLLLSEVDEKTYIGSTNDIDRRIAQHNEGLCKSTRHKRPLQLIYIEAYKSLAEVRKRERYLKTTSGRRELKKIFEFLNSGE